MGTQVLAPYCLALGGMGKEEKPKASSLASGDYSLVVMDPNLKHEREKGPQIRLCLSYRFKGPGKITGRGEGWSRTQHSQGGLGEYLRTEIQGRTYSGREEKGSVAEGDRVEGSTKGEEGGDQVSLQEGEDCPVGGREVLGMVRRYGRSGLGRNTCFVQSGRRYMKSKNVHYPLT